MTECCICTEKFNKTFRKKVSCVYCVKICCADCFGNFIMSSSNFEPSCMFCNKNLTFDFVIENLSKKKVNNYSNHRYEIIFNREKSLLPETQVIVNRILKLQKLVEYRRSLTVEKRNKKNELVSLRYYIITYEEDEIELTKLLFKKDKIKLDIRELRFLINECTNLINRINNNEDDEEEEKPKFIMKCPDGECKGYLSSAYKCETCTSYFCSDCHVKKNDRNDDSHVCEEDTKATVSLLKLDTKPCPKCMTPIYKVSGCDQMWCLTCKTAFSWNTGKIDNGYIHNPEYFRYMRDNGMNIERNPGDNVGNCNQIPNYDTVISNVSYSINRVDVWYRILSHIKHHEMIILPRDVRNIDYSNFRIDYLMDIISEDKWKKELKAVIKKNEKNHEIYQVYDLFCQVMTDHFHVLFEDKNVDIFVDNSNKILEYCNTMLRNINKKYNSANKHFIIKVEEVEVEN